MIQRIPVSGTVRPGAFEDARMTVSRTCIMLLAVAILWAAPAATHPPDECRTTLANFEAHAKTFEESAKVTRPVLARLFAAWDEIEHAESHARRHALIFRHFVAGLPLLRTHLSTEAESSVEAVRWARQAIFCLRRDRPTP